MKYRTLGHTGVNVSVLGFGTMRLPCKDGRIDEKEAIEILRLAIDSGLNYIDTAYFYHDNESERLVGKAMADGYRSKAYIATKSPVHYIKKEGDFDRILDEQLHKLNTDYIDFYLLHALNLEAWNKTVLPFNLLDKLIRAKEAGKIRHIGFSFHDNFDAFKTIVDGFDKWEFCQIQLNYVDTHNQAGLKGLKYAAERGLGVIIMEPLLGGRLANPTPAMKRVMPDRKSPVLWAFDFLWNMPEVATVLSGMSTREQVLENISFASQAGAGCLSEEETEMLKEVRNIFLNMPLVPCTKCEYCMPCPFGLDIPGIFDAFNKTISKSKKHALNLYNEIKTRADSCRKCLKCEKKCPQGIKISSEMEKIAEEFSKIKE